MTRKNISEVVSNINQKYVLEAEDYTATRQKTIFSRSKWIATAACFCLLLGVLSSYVMLKQKTEISTPDDGANFDNPIRGEMSQNTESNKNETTILTNVGEQVSVYEIMSFDWNSNTINDIQTSLTTAGWSNMECTYWDEYDFVLKGSNTSLVNQMTEDDCTTLAETFLQDSGLIELFKENKLAYECTSSVADDLIVTYCYFLCENERTGAYIRFVFEDYKCIGEVQAHIYSSKCIDTLELLTFDQALNNAYKVSSEGELEEVNAADYTIKNEELVYVNGLPYYRFDGYGINIRSFIDGYALAINIEDSASPEKLAAQHGSFKIN